MKIVKVVTSVNPKTIALPLQVLFDTDTETGLHLFAVRLFSYTIAIAWR